MIDEHDLVEQAVRALVRQKPAFDDLIQRRDRKRRNQRIAAGVVGIAVFVAAIWIVTSGMLFDRSQTPADRGRVQTGPTDLEGIRPAKPPGADGSDVGHNSGSDYLLDLETGATTPLPESISGDGRNGYAISPDGSQVAFYALGPPESGFAIRGIFVAHLDGSQVQQIADGAIFTHVGQGGTSPSSLGWSPDGTMIAYVGRVEGGHGEDIFVVDLTNGGTTQVTFEAVDVSGPSFSPDGSSIVYTDYVPDGAPAIPRNDGYEVRIVPITGDEGSRLVGGSGTSAEDGSLSPADAIGASISPDGSLLSYVCAGPHQAGFASDLCLANADGSDPRIIASSPPHYGIMDASWSPDGTQLAYWTFHSWNVYVMDVATGETTHVGNGAYPSWLDDHTLIIEPYFGGA